MSITITLDKSGRLPISKAIRESLGLREGSRLVLDVHGGKLEAVPEMQSVRIIMKNGFPVIQGGLLLKSGDTIQAIHAERK